MKKIKLAVIGGGVYGTQMLKCFFSQQNLGKIDLVALADLDENILGQHAQTFGVTTFLDFREMLEKLELDAVAIATPDHLHAAIIHCAVKQGIHVLCQKPLDLDVKSAYELVELCEKENILLYVDFHKRFDAGHMRLKADIANGCLGKLQYGFVHMEDRIEVPSVWLKKWAVNSSPSWFLGVHFYDLVYWLTRAKPISVFASGNKGKLESMGISGAWDSIQATVCYDTGLTMSYHLSWILPNSFPSIVNQGIRLVGEEGIAEVDSQDRGFFSAYSNSTGSIHANPFGALEDHNSLHGFATRGYTFESMAFFIEVLEQFRNGKSLAELSNFYPTGRSAIVATQIGVGVEKSIQSGSSVNI